MKLLTKYKWWSSQTLLWFIPIESKGVSFIFCNEFIFFSSDLLWRYFFDYGNAKVIQRKVILVSISRVHRESRLFPFSFTETAPMYICSVVRFLNCTTEICLFVSAQTAYPQVDHIFILTVQVLWDSHWYSIYQRFLIFVDQGALFTSRTVTFLTIGGTFTGIQTQEFISDQHVSQGAVFFNSKHNLGVTN